uniref:Uncharacterized protein n=1 Tax=Trichuris muris TaxID=70415 RepID=A0A5S6Q029_TRIMR
MLHAGCLPTVQFNVAPSGLSGISVSAASFQRMNPMNEITLPKSERNDSKIASLASVSAKYSKKMYHLCKVRLNVQLLALSAFNARPIFQFLNA